MPDQEKTDVPSETWTGDSSTGNRVMTREDLYALVWQTPMSRLAKRFGLSDVGLRKICAKHSIPTPPQGYWAKLAHKKKVHRPPLSPLKDGESIHIRLHPRLGMQVASAVETAQAAALLEGEARHSPITVPPERPRRLHPVAAATAKAVHSAEVDHEGFKHTRAQGAVDVMIGPASIDRALCIIDAFARAAEERGHGIAENENGVRIVVDGVPIAWRLYEVKDHKTHLPTREELKAQARREEDQARWPNLYPPVGDSKVYRLWDYFPSGRLAIAFTDATRFGWARELLIGRWHDRKGRRLEDCLDEAMAALAMGAVAVNHRLAEEAEKERLRAEELEKRRRAQAQHERVLRRHEFVLRKADEYARFEKLAAFADFLQREAYRYSDEPGDRIIDELKSLVATMAESFKRETFNDEIVRLQLYTADDPIAKSFNDL